MVGVFQVARNLVKSPMSPSLPLASLPLASYQCTDGQSQVGKNSGMRKFLRKAQLPTQPELQTLSMAPTLQPHLLAWAASNSTSAGVPGMGTRWGGGHEVRFLVWGERKGSRPGE